MAESTLSVGSPELRKAVARFLGYSTTSSDWSAAQLDEITDIVASGIRQFYNPPPLPGKEYSHEWRFMRPTTTLTTTANDIDQDLPDAFGYIIGDFTYASANNRSVAIKVIGEGELRAMRQGGTPPTGFPQYAAIRPLNSAATSGQRYEVMWYPTPDATYTLSYQFQALKDAVTTVLPYPFGGAQHAETILQSCLAIAEERSDDVRGLHWQKFIERLAASISADVRTGAQYHGYNGDSSGGCSGDSMRPHDTDFTVTVGGVSY